MFALAVLLASGDASGGAPETAIRVTYAAPSSCPPRERLIEHVQARTARARIARPGEEARELLVRIERAPDGRFHGRLVIEDGAERQERAVSDPGCEELIEALGFFIALSIDPNASMASAPSSAPRTPATEPMPVDPGHAIPPHPGAASTAPLPVQPPPAVEPPLAPPSIAPTSATPRDVPDDEEREDAPPLARTWRVAGGFGMGLVSGATPRTAIASRVLVEVSWLPKDGSAFAPAAGLTATSTTTSTLDSPFGGLALRWRALTGTFCPIALPLVKHVSLRPCTGMEIGALRGDGVAIRNARRHESPWVALGLFGQADLAVWNDLVLIVEGGISTPFTRSRFTFSTGTPVFETPAFGGRAGIMLALRR